MAHAWQVPWIGLAQDDGASAARDVEHLSCDASWLDGEQTHAQLASCHALDLGAKVHRCK